ncbi:unnamed protein product [Rotaria sp. Silwood1]|nr:unnamed protein product [Rotaria sp. Silwood1]CAF1687336.1 unnamed protein product [Rotaria sp. Silwood1]
MTRIASMIWYWSLPILPFTAIITFILTLVVCSQVLHNPRPGGDFPQISLLGIGPAYKYFLSGFVILSLQLLLILIGRLQFLCHSQFIIHRTILYIIHAIALVSAVFLLIMAIVSLDDDRRLHVIGAFGMFGFLSLYGLLHTIVAFYLFIRRSAAPQHSNILWPLWFLICSILLIVFSSIWVVKDKTVPQYIAAAMPFLYLLAFVPQFWMQARIKRQDNALTTQVRHSDEMNLFTATQKF